MFFRITGAPFEIRKAQVLKARGDMSVNLYGTPAIYWLYLNMCGRTYYPPVCLQFYFILLFIYYSYSDTISFLPSAVSNGRLTVNNRSKRSAERRSCPSCQFNPSTYYVRILSQSTNIPARTVGLQPEIQNDHPNQKKITA